MKAKDLRERTVDDLRELEKSLAKDTFTHRFKNFTNRLDDTSVINKTKRDLARVKTILQQMEKGKAAPVAAAAAVEAAPKKKAAAAPKKTAAKKTSAAKKTEAK
jgi:large subunit ribosomal protein L29